MFRTKGGKADFASHLCFRFGPNFLESNFWSPSLLDSDFGPPGFWTPCLGGYFTDIYLDLATCNCFVDDIILWISFPFLFTWQNAPTSYRHQMGISEASARVDEKIANEKQKRINAKCSTNTMNTCVYYKSSIISCMHIIFQRWSNGSCFHMYHEFFKKYHNILLYRMQTLLFHVISNFI